jgi:hypothetical protein
LGAEATFVSFMPDLKPGYNLIRCSGHLIGYHPVIASQRVGAKRRPMTGSAKQSIAATTNGLLRRFAPRNDSGKARSKSCLKKAC